MPETRHQQAFAQAVEPAAVVIVDLYPVHHQSSRVVACLSEGLEIEASYLAVEPYWLVVAVVLVVLESKIMTMMMMVDSSSIT